MKIKIRSAYSPQLRTQVPEVESKIVTKQEFKNECNINTIVERMKRGIQPPPWMTQNTPYYGDISNAPKSFQDAFEIVDRAQAAFESLPLEFRRAIDHDPRKLADAPKELFAQFGLLRPEASSAATGASGAQVPLEGEGRRDLPSKSAVGAKKGSEGANQTPKEESKAQDKA